MEYVKEKPDLDLYTLLWTILIKNIKTINYYSKQNLKNKIIDVKLNDCVDNYLTLVK